MYYIAQTEKSFMRASTDLEAAVTKHGFGLLHAYDFGEILRSKGINFNEECKIFEICNPEQAAKVLAIDIHLNMALPCRISVFTEKGVTKIGLIKARPVLSALSDNSVLAAIADEVEKMTIQIVDDAK